MYYAVNYIIHELSLVQQFDTIAFVIPLLLLIGMSITGMSITGMSITGM